MELLLLVVIRFNGFFFGFDDFFFISYPPPTYQKLLFILISIVLFTSSWLFSTFIKMPDKKGSVCIWSLMQFACFFTFILTYCGPPGEGDLQTIKGQNSLFKSSLRCMTCVLHHTPFFTSAEVSTVYLFPPRPHDCNNNKGQFVLLFLNYESNKGTGWRTLSGNMSQRNFKLQVILHFLYFFFLIRF